MPTMLPEFVTSSYRSYKADTTDFTTWLCQTALLSGFESPSCLLKESSAATHRGGGRLKGKARKKAKETVPEPTPNLTPARYTTTVKDLLAQAKVVARSVKPHHKMPQHILRAVRRAISARQRCTAWFRDNSNVENGQSTEKHQYFIDVMEEALTILEPCCTSTKAIANAACWKNDINDRLQHGSLRKASPNLFKLLDVEPLRDTSGTTALQDDAEEVPLSTESQQTCTVYELDLAHDTGDATFAIFCFFEDLRQIEQCIVRTWSRYKCFYIDLITASLVTNAALDIARRAESDLFSSHQIIQGGEKISPYDSIIHLALPIESPNDLGHSENAQESDSLDYTSHRDFMYSNFMIAHLLHKSTDKQDVGEPGSGKSIMPCRMPHSQKIPSCDKFCQDHPKMFPLPESQKPYRADELVTQVMIELAFDEGLRTCVVVKKMPDLMGENELNRSLRMLVKGGSLTVGSTFAAQLLDDIHGALDENTSTSYDELIDAACRALHLVHPPGSIGSDGESTGTIATWTGQDNHIIYRALEILNDQIMHHPLPETKMSSSRPVKTAERREEPRLEEDSPSTLRQDDPRSLQPTIEDDDGSEILQESQGPRGHDPVPGNGTIMPATDPHFMFTSNPVHCGTTALKLAIAMETAALTLANWHKTIFGAAHLYNALRQTGLVPDHWPEFDALIELQITPIFMGGLPKTVHEMHRRLEMRLGSSALNYARNRRATKNSFVLSKRSIPDLVGSELSRIFRPYFEDGMPMEACLARLERAMRLKSASRPKRESSPPAGSLPFLTEMQDWIERSLPILRTNYIMMTRKCTILLELVRRAIPDPPPTWTWVEKVDGSETDPGLVVMVLGILDEARELPRFDPDAPQRKARADEEEEEPMLVIASRVFAAFLKREKSKAEGDVGEREVEGDVGEKEVEGDIGQSEAERDVRQSEART